MKPVRETTWRGRKALFAALAVFGVLFTAMSGYVVVSLFGDTIRMELMGGGCLGGGPASPPPPTSPVARKSLHSLAHDEPGY